MTDPKSISVAFMRNAARINRMLLKLYENKPDMSNEVASLVISGYIHCVLTLIHSDEMEFQKVSIVHGFVKTDTEHNTSYEQYWLEFYNEIGGRVAVIDPLVHMAEYRNKTIQALSALDNVGPMLILDHIQMSRFNMDYEIMR